MDPLMDKLFREYQVHPMVWMTSGDDRDHTDWQSVKNRPWPPGSYTEDFKRTVRFVDAPYPMIQIDALINKGGLQWPEHLSYTS